VAKLEQDAFVQLHFRVPKALHARLDAARKQGAVTLSAEIVRRLEQSFERRDRGIDGRLLWRELFKTETALSGATAQIYKALSREKDAPDSLRDAMCSVADALEQTDAQIKETLGKTFPVDIFRHRRGGAEQEDDK
jgi:hypothetical protein